MAKRIINSAIVGCGVIGPTHAMSLRDIDGARLVAVCDVVPEKAEKMAREYGCAAYTDLDEMLKQQPEIDLGHVCVPSGLHAEIGIRAARAGKNVITEKPIDVTVEAADRLIAACREAGVLLSCISQHRFDDAMLQVKAALDAGKFGQLNFGGSHTKWYRSQEYYDSGDWRGTWELDGGGALMNQSVHYVDLLQYVLGPVEEVQAYCATRAHQRIEVEDIAAAVLRFRSGAVGMLEGNTTAWPGYQTRLDIYGETGSVIIENDEIRAWNFMDGTPNPGATGGNGGGGAASAAIPYRSHMRQIADVVEAVREGRPPRITGEDARHPLAIICAVYEAARTGKPVRIQ